VSRLTDACLSFNDGYRLILSHPTYIAGQILARAGRIECKPCIAGLRQCSIAFGHLWELAEEVEQIYRAAVGHAGTPLYPLARGGSGAGSGLASPAGDLTQEPAVWHRVDGGQDGAWNVPGAGAYLVRDYAQYGARPRLISQAANGFTSLPMVSRDGLPHAPTREAASALFDWIHRT
jgi:hypothetical protein